MIFYRNLFISVILSALLFLAVLAYFMYKQNLTHVYPPIEQTCPDFYSLNTATNKCEANQVWGFQSGQTYTSTRTTLNCPSVEFTGANVGGMGAKSTLCTKKKWAEDCGVTWDGITNNNMICYSQYVQ